MKHFWFSLAVLLLMLALCLANAFYMDELTTSVTDRLEDAETLAERGAWAQAEDITRQCFDDWQRHHNYLHIVSRHQDTDDILIAFHSTLQYLKLEEMDQYAAQNLDLITKIKLLSEMEQPDWLNVL